MTKKKTLPAKLSARLRLAVADAKKLLRRKNYRFNPDVWYTKDGKGVCEICLGGALLAGTLGANPDDEYLEVFYGLSARTTDRVLDLDDLRCGLLPSHVADRLSDAKYDRISAKLYEIINGSRFSNGRAPWSAYLKAADYLESEGL